MKFSVIVADPCWSYEDKLRMKGTVGVHRSADSHYDVMEVDDIIELPVLDVAAANCVLALWCPNALILTHGAAVMRAWGFIQKQTFTWVKTTNDRSRPRPGMGRMFRNATELALIGVRGKPKCLNKSQLGVALDPWLGHSTKPDTLQLRLEKMFDGPRAELFARRDLPGWTCTGLECPSTLGVDIRDWLALQSAANDGGGVPRSEDVPVPPDARADPAGRLHRPAEGTGSPEVPGRADEEQG